MKQLYSLLRRVSEIIAPHCADQLFDYMIHSMDDDGGFLRSRYCYWPETVKDRGKGELPAVVLITAKEDSNFDDPSSYYLNTCDGEDNRHTNLKFQIYYTDFSDDDSYYSEAEWAAQLGFTRAIRIYLKSGTYTAESIHSVI